MELKEFQEKLHHILCEDGFECQLAQFIESPQDFASYLLEITAETVIDIETENTSVIENQFDYDGSLEGLLGWQVIEPDMPILGFVSGGDWQIPMYWSICFKNGRFWMFVPKSGNVYDKFTNEPYLLYDEDDEVFGLEDSLEFSAERMREDIKAFLSS